MSFEEALKELGDWGMAYLAEFLIAGVLLLAGLMVGWLLQIIARSLLSSMGLDGFAERSGLSGVLRQTARTEQTVSQLAGRIVFWSVFLYFLAASLETVGMPRVSEYMVAIGAFLPRVLAALLLLIAGIYGGRASRELFPKDRSRRGDPKTWQWVSQLVQVAVVSAAVLLALASLGLNLMPLLWFLGALVMAAALLLAIAWGPVLRERSIAWLAARWLRQQLEIGDQVHIGEIEGTVAKFGDAHLTVRTAEGLILLPNKMVSEQALTVLGAPVSEEVDLPSLP